MQKHNDYTFGDSDRAAERLYWLSRTFDAETLAYVKRAVRQQPRCCVDLGAGPGYLTRGLHHALESGSTIGLESSPRFVELGVRDLEPGIALLQHDVTQPLPVRGDLMTARFLLTHLRDPLAALRTWRASEPTLLILEELVAMTSELPVLQRYYELVALVQRAAGQDMHIGTRLGGLALAAGFALESHAVQRLELPVRAMTRLHALNLPTLRTQPIVKERFEEAELDAMQVALLDLAEAGSGVVHVHMARCRAVLA
ncbi:MAG TPA: class I SAM-dependent methyltransferase [Polyangiales bacterium]|nr:class I SAM-dependent methyltransferase [Polyangiales bacterium]